MIYKTIIKKIDTKNFIICKLAGQLDNNNSSIDEVLPIKYGTFFLKCNGTLLYCGKNKESYVEKPKIVKNIEGAVTKIIIYNDNIVIILTDKGRMYYSTENCFLDIKTIDNTDLFIEDFIYNPYNQFLLDNNGKLYNYKIRNSILKEIPFLQGKIKRYCQSDSNHCLLSVINEEGSLFLINENNSVTKFQIDGRVRDARYSHNVFFAFTEDGKTFAWGG